MMLPCNRQMSGVPFVIVTRIMLILFRQSDGSHWWWRLRIEKIWFWSVELPQFRWMRSFIRPSKEFWSTRLDVPVVKPRCLSVYSSMRECLMTWPFCLSISNWTDWGEWEGHESQSSFAAHDLFALVPMTWSNLDCLWRTNYVHFRWNCSHHCRYVHRKRSHRIRFITILNWYLNRLSSVWFRHQNNVI